MAANTLVTRKIKIYIIYNFISIISNIGDVGNKDYNLNPKK